MELNELDQILGYIHTYDDEDIAKFSKIVKKDCKEKSNLYYVYEDTFYNSNADPHFERKPFYNFLLSYISIQMSDFKKAIQHANWAEFEFKEQGQRWNRAICNWLLGLLWCKYKEFKKADAHIELAIELMGMLETEELSRGIYDDEFKKMSNLMQESFSSTVDPILLFQELLQDNQPAIALLSRIVSCLHVPENLANSVEFRRYVLDRDYAAKAQNDTETLFLNLYEISETQSDLERAFAFIFLAYCSDFDFEEFQNAEYYISQAIELFESQSDNYNRVLCDCYLSLFSFMTINDPEIRQSHLINAHYILNEFIESSRDTVNTEEIQTLRNELANWIFQHDIQENQPNGSSGITEQSYNSSPEDQLPRKHNSVVSGIKGLINKKVAQERQMSIPRIAIPQSTSSGKPSMVITIPVDIQALIDQKQTALMDENLYEKLKLYNRQYNNIKRQPKSIESFPSEDNVPNSSYFIIPSYPIYSQVTAGPDGEPALDETGFELASSIDINYIVILEGHSYKIHSVKGDDNKINTSRYGKYGWCKVIGDSMNNSAPIPIDDGDYILFCQHNDPETCDDKIVVVSQPEHGGQPPRLMVKRLIIIRKNLKRSNSETIIKKYYLHSESLRRTYKDIEMQEDYRLIGEVIAIAKLQ